MINKDSFSYIKRRVDYQWYSILQALNMILKNGLCFNDKYIYFLSVKNISLIGKFSLIAAN